MKGGGFPSLPARGWSTSLAPSYAARRWEVVGRSLLAGMLALVCGPMARGEAAQRQVVQNQVPNGQVARSGRRCSDESHEGASYTVCVVDTASDDLSLFLQDPSGRPYATFEQLAASLARTRRRLVFAMNAGMFEADLWPVGLYVEGGAVRHAANTRDGPGNFHMKPNGVFYFGPDGAGVMETTRFLEAHIKPDFATQSGPMLVIDGVIHPKIQPDGTSLKVRNGVGIRDRHTIVFAISKQPVSFHQFADLFRDGLGCRNALFLDGTVSALYAPDIGRWDQWQPIGPIVGVTEPSPIPPSPLAPPERERSGPVQDAGGR